LDSLEINILLFISTILISIIHSIIESDKFLSQFIIYILYNCPNRNHLSFYDSTVQRQYTSIWHHRR